MDKKPLRNQDKLIQMIEKEEVNDLLRVLEMTNKINESKTRMMDGVYRKMIPKPQVL